MKVPVPLYASDKPLTPDSLVLAVSIGGSNDENRVGRLRLVNTVNKQEHVLLLGPYGPYGTECSVYGKLGDLEVTMDVGGRAEVILRSMKDGNLHKWWFEQPNPVRCDFDFLDATG